MVELEMLNALYGDCLLLRYDDAGETRTWLIDGGPKPDRVDGRKFYVLDDVLLPRLQALGNGKQLEVSLGMVSHIDDDHINGLQQLLLRLQNSAHRNAEPVVFQRFWFNAFDDLVESQDGGAPAQADAASLASTEVERLPKVPDEDGAAVMESVRQGKTLASSIRALGLAGNDPFSGLIVAHEKRKRVQVDGAHVTVLGPLQSRLDKLRVEWAKARSKPTRDAQQAATQELFLPDKKLDTSVPNLSSIVLLVEVDGRKLLLTGDAQGKDVVTAWQELGLGDGPVTIDLLKMPHHGSIRNTPEVFLKFFPAKHYLFSANGRDDNPDAQTVEAVVKLYGARDIVLYFSNRNAWAKEYTIEKNGLMVDSLPQLIDELRVAYGGLWQACFRADANGSIVAQL